MKQVDFLFGVHDHQPVGNFGHVFREAFDRCYRPFLDVFAQFPKIHASVHTSGPLLEWLSDNEPGYLDLLRAMVAAGRVEILGGGFYEPILPSLPERDAVGQIKMMAAWAEKRFGQRPAGMWLAERVWDPYLPRVLAKAGMKFTVLDDTHFRAAGLKDEEMRGYFLTEREGDTVGVYPIDKGLRYRIPFAKPEEIIEYLRGLAQEPTEGQPVPAVTYADDGEKFGLWPDTYKWVYEERWLARFFQVLSENSEWLHTKTLGEHFAANAPTGRLYLPTASYDEMMEWALPAGRILDYEKVSHDEASPAKAFIRGGFWPNFMVKYPEANWMSKRATFASAAVAKAMGGDAAVMAAASAEPPEMLKKLWKSQCNCGYWHGLFGGLYLNYIRHANYTNLIDAEKMVEQKIRSREDHLEHEEVDVDRDGRDELVVTGRFLNAFVKPDAGGSITEIDFKPKSFNVSNVMTRRFEPYHRKLTQAEVAGTPQGDKPKTIHDIVRVKEPNLDKKLQYDRYGRASFLDHFLGEGTTLDAFRTQTYHETGWFAGAPYKLVASDFTGTKDGATVILSRTAEVDAGGRRTPVEVEKTFVFSRRSPSVAARYRVTNKGAHPVELFLAVELNLTLLAGDADDRFYEIPGKTLESKKLSSIGAVPGADGIDLVDRWSQFRIMLRFPETTELWRYPIETVSQSEGGFEANYQGSCVAPTWKFALSPGESAERTMKIGFGDA